MKKKAMVFLLASFLCLSEFLSVSVEASDFSEYELKEDMIQNEEDTENDDVFESKEELEDDFNFSGTSETEKQSDSIDEESVLEVEEEYETEGKLFASGNNYLPRVVKPETNNPYWYSNLNIFYSAQINQCTWYAYGRAYELLGKAPDLFLSYGSKNGEDWYGHNKSLFDNNNGGYPYSSDINSPQLGAIACFNGKTGYGHVAIVEAIENGRIIFSEGGQSINGFHYGYDMSVKLSQEWNPDLEFQGYIYLPVSHNTPQGHLDSVVGGSGCVTVRGWAFDPDDPAQALDIHVYIGGPAGSGAPGYVIKADKLREDVGNAYPGYGNYHGFWEEIYTDKVGEQKIYIYAINVGAGENNPLIGCGTVSITQDTGAPSITNAYVSQYDKNGYTVVAEVTDNVGVTKVLFPTCRADEGAWKWHEGTKVGENVFSYRVNISDFGSKEENYFTDIYAYDAAGNHNAVGWHIEQYIDTSAPVYSNVKMERLSADTVKISCDVKDSSVINKVAFAVWTEKDGQDDLMDNWSNLCFGTKVGSTYSFLVKDSDHGYEHGKYFTHIYAWDEYGNIGIHSLEYLFENTFEPVASYNGVHRYELYDDLVTWEEAKKKCEELGGHLATITFVNEQNKILDMLGSGSRASYFIGGCTQDGESTWITGEKFKYSHWAAGEPNNDLNGLEYVYEIRKSGEWNDCRNDQVGCGFVCEYGTPDTSAPVYSNVKIQRISADTIQISCDVNDDSPVVKTSFAVWTEENGQDDLAENWPERCLGTKNGSTYSYLVKDSEHNFEHGNYITHIYAWDVFGNIGTHVLKYSFENTFEPVASYNGVHRYELYDDLVTWEEAKKKCEELGGHLATITFVNEQNKILDMLGSGSRASYFIGGCTQDGEPTWITGEKFKYSHWAAGEPNSDLNGLEYVYEIRKNGEWNDCRNEQVGCGFICEYGTPDTSAPVYSNVKIQRVSADTIQISCDVNDDSPVVKASFAVWTEENGQDDLAENWPERCLGTKNGSTYSYLVKDSEHNFEHGNYITHIYAWDVFGNIGTHVLKYSFDNIFEPVASYNDGHRYELYDDLVTWQEAKEKCEELGGHLATITSSNEQKKIQELFDSGSRVAYFIGGCTQNGKSTWITGEDFNYSHWAAGEPNSDLNGQEYVYEMRKNGEWNDCRNDQTGCGFICEYESVSKCKIIFNTQGGEVLSPLECDINSSPELPVPEKNGCIFTGWYQDAEYKTPWKVGNNKVITDIVLYASWIENNEEYEGLWIREIPEQEYTGNPIKPDVEVFSGTERLTLGKDYTISYRNNVKAGTAQAIVKGKGNYTKSMSIDFTILPKRLTEKDVIITCGGKVYNGKPQISNPVVKWGKKTLKKGTDYDVKFSNDQISKGTVTVTVTGKNNYSETVETEYRITEKDISKAIFGSISIQTYSGAVLEPEVTVYASATDKKAGKTLIENTDYKVEYVNNTDVGTGKAVISGLGEYGGTKTLSFSIVKRKLTEKAIQIEILEESSDLIYTGIALKPMVRVTDGETVLKENIDYTVSYANNKNAVTSITSANKYPTIMIKGKGNYTGTRTKTFMITPRILGKNGTAENGVFVTVADAKYNNGKELKPSIIVRFGTKILKNGSDYAVLYTNNQEIGEANSASAPTATIIGKGNYDGTIVENFRIYEKAASGFIADRIAPCTYSGNPDHPDNPKVDVYASLADKKEGKLLTEGIDYEVEYLNNNYAGTGKAVITGLGEYGGTKVVTYTIEKRKLTSANVNVTVTDNPLTYTGGKLKPSVCVMDGEKELVAGVDYTVSYVNNVNVPVSSKKLPTVIIKGKGNYTGSRNEYFVIEQKVLSAENGISINVKDICFSQKKADSKSGLIPAFTVKDGTKTLKKGTHYTVTYSNNRDVGEMGSDKAPTITITGKGNYAGTFATTFRIYEKEISSATIQKLSNVFYTGSVIEPKPTLTIKISKSETKTLTEGIDYTLSWENQVKVGKGKVVITGKGMYGGTRTVTFLILPKWMQWFQ